MKRLWPLLALLLMAAAPDENRQFRVGQAAFDDKIYDVAERQLQEFLQKFPQSERADSAQYLLGQAQLNLGKWEDAVRTLQEGMTKWPDKRPDAMLFWMGEAFNRGGKFAEAETRYLEVADKYPKSKFFTQALYGMAFVQLRQGLLKPAGASLDRLIAAEPKTEMAYQGELLRGQVDLAREDFNKAESGLETVAQKAGPGNRVYYQAHFWIGESLTRHNQFADALTHYAVITDSFKAKPNKPVDAQLAAEAWFGAGWAQWQQNKFPEAADAYHAVLGIAPGVKLKRDALLKLAEANVRSGNIGDGVLKLKEFLQAHPNDPIRDEVQLAIADLFFGKGEPALALTEYVQLINVYTNSPVRPRAYAQAGWSAWQLKKLPEALDFFQKALPLTTDKVRAAEVQFKIADVNFALGQFKEAVIAYQQLIQTYPESMSLDRAFFQLGESQRQLQNREGATSAFQSVVRQYPKSEYAPPSQYNLGQLLSAQGQEAGARAAFALVVSNFSASVWASNAALAVGESFIREGKYELAIAEFDRLAINGLETDLSQQAFYHRGAAYAMTGKREKTLTEFQDFLKTHPQAKLAPDIQYWVGDEYLRQADYLKAQAQFQLVAENYPTSKVADVALYFAGRAAYARQDYKVAVEKYEALLKTYPQSRWCCEARFGQGDALSELGQYDDALLVFEALAKEFPKCTLVGDAYGRKGDCQYTLTRYDDALVSYRKALDSAEDAAMRNQALCKLGNTYLALKKPAEALQQYTKAVYETATATDPDMPVERRWSCQAAQAAASIKEQSNEWRDAITLYGKMGELCPDLKALAEDHVRKLLVLHPETFLPH